MDKVRVKRIRRLVSRLNKARRAQAKKIDILCNDMVKAHTDFVGKLKLLNFVLGFYESLLAENDLSGILTKAAESVSNWIKGSNVAVFLAEDDSIKIHVPDQSQPIDIDFKPIEACFDQQLVKRISRANWICSLEDMGHMGLDTEADCFKTISVAAIPIKSVGPGIGFLLIYCSPQNKFNPEQLQQVLAVMPGLYNAVRSTSAVTNACVK